MVRILPTQKDAASNLGRFKVWASGDAEMEWGIEGNVHARHYDLISADDLATCVDDLEKALLSSLQ